MFTGLIEEVGRVSAIRLSAAGGELEIEAPALSSTLELGDSIAVNGVCLTVIQPGKTRFTVQAVAETLRKSNLQSLTSGSAVNLERALLPTTRLGGHLVQGHVDCTALVVEKIRRTTGFELVLEPPASFLKYAAPTGSLAVDGVSLTIAAQEGNRLRVAVIPHTSRATNLGELTPGRRVNLEMDCIAKYTEQLLRHGGQTANLEALLRS